MDSVMRTIVMYVFVMVIFRISGTRTLSEITAFDFVLLLIIGEAVQQALLGNDYSIANAFVVIGTLLGMDIVLSMIKQRFQPVEHIIEGMPLMLIKNGEIQQEVLKKTRLDENDILHAARQLQGLENLDQVKHAVLEVSGGITIVPKPGTGS